MQEFLKELFTLRTVYIDKGQGQWAVRKRLHPFTRCLMLIIAITAGGFIYSKSGNAPEIVEANDSEIKTAKLIKPEPVRITLPPIQTVTAVKPETEKIEKAERTLIPVNNNPAKTASLPAPVKTSRIILPSEKDPDTDRIITKKNNNKYRIIVNKSNHTLSLLKGDELVKNYPVATGKNTGDKERVGDHRTPVGNFKIVSIENASSWTHDFRDGKGKIAGAYGPWFLRLDAKGWRGIGIHGTHDPDSRGTNATEGCIRLSNEDIAELKEKYAYRNMPVEIREN